MTDSQTQLNGGSLNISEQHKQELKQLFPGAFTETKNDKGEVVETLDFERLKAELGEFSELYDNRRMEENLKIICGEAHFKALSGIDYSVATSTKEVVSMSSRE